MSQYKITILLIIILIGFIVPFVPFLAIIEMFFLLIPFAVIFLATMIYLIASFFIKNVNRSRAILIFSVLPIFIISQVASCFIVNQIQTYRSNQIVADIEQIKYTTGKYPEIYELMWGLKYRKFENNENYVIKFSIGFLATRKYLSENKRWISNSWNG